MKYNNSRFKFSPRELRGIAVLLFAAGVFLGIVLYLNSKRVEKISERSKEIIVYDSIRSAVRDYEKRAPQGKKEIAFFEFDPNTLELEKWQLFGLTEKQVATIEKYRQAGAVFRKKEDVRKLYVISDELYLKLEPYIKIDIDLAPLSDTLKRGYLGRGSKSEYFRFYDTLCVDINVADSIRLADLKGIGNVIAKRIVKYRTRLGGFHSCEQLLEVYGIDSLRYNGFKKNIVVSSGRVNKIDINNVEFKQLLSHPYFDYHIVKSIFNYKNRVGSVKSIDALKDIDLMTDVIYKRIMPYLTIE